ncbi:hypothetical protein B296_00027177, partial [Ensete ventricosum]
LTVADRYKSQIGRELGEGKDIKCQVYVGVASPANERGGSPWRGVLRKKGVEADRRRSRGSHDDGLAKRRHLRALQSGQVGNRGGRRSLNPTEQFSGSRPKGNVLHFIPQFSYIFIYSVVAVTGGVCCIFVLKTYSTLTQSVGVEVKGMCCNLVLYFTSF